MAKKQQKKWGQKKKFVRDKSMRTGYRSVVIPKRILPTLRTGGWTNAKGELKYFDAINAQYSMDVTTTNVLVLNAMSQNTGASERIGKQIYNKSIRVHGNIAPNSNSTSYNVGRIMLVWDAQPNGVIATTANVLTGATPTSAADLNLDNRERFTVLRDQRYAVDPHAGGAAKGIVFDMFVNLKNQKTTFNNTGAGISNLATGALLLVYLGLTSTSTEIPSVNITTRLRYYDN